MLDHLTLIGIEPSFNGWITMKAGNDRKNGGTVLMGVFEICGGWAKNSSKTEHFRVDD
jgi:hypothetical protein